MDGSLFMHVERNDSSLPAFADPDVAELLFVVTTARSSSMASPVFLLACDVDALLTFDDPS